MLLLNKSPNTKRLTYKDSLFRCGFTDQKKYKVLNYCVEKIFELSGCSLKRVDIKKRGCPGFETAPFISNKIIFERD
jgi:hypothetical protein